MHAMEGSSSYLSAGKEDVGYRKVLLLVKSDDSRRRKGPSVGVQVVVGHVKKFQLGCTSGNSKCDLPLAVVRLMG